MRIAALLSGSLIAFSCNAAQLQVSVVDNRGQGVGDVVVVATAVSAAPSTQPKSDGAIAVMDQIDKRFVPEVLVVKTGTAVSFPNSDSVAHQVYSFSATKRFALPLYRGRPHAPLVFEQPGIVVLGCNIHDQMIGYIYVTDSPHFAKSNAQGRVAFSSLASGAYRLSVWHARLDEQVDEQEFKLNDAEPKQTTVQLRRALRPTPKPADGRIRDY